MLFISDADIQRFMQEAIDIVEEASKGIFREAILQNEQLLCEK
ncbi:MAG: hypothetical protein QXZ47_00435 [Candidatus Bathyarchaeia archaeon]